MTPVPVAVKEPEKPKGFLERFEEFPNLLKQQQQPSLNTTNTTALPLPPQRPPQKLLGGDFNFLEDDDWLDGDNIDYSQNLFEDDDHFLPSYILEETGKKPVDDKEIETNTSNNSNSGLCHVKAKSLLAERHHSSKKKDIWKRTDEHKQQEQEQPKMKIKILKRPTSESKVEAKVEVKEVKEEHGVATTTSIVPATEQLVKKFSTSLKLHETTVEEPKQQPQSQQPQQPQKPLKIVYSSASKTLQKM